MTTTTRMAPHGSGGIGEIRDEAARHYDERGLAALMLMIATTHVYNRLTVTIRQPVGAGG